jgi:hypothetical protein
MIKYILTLLFISTLTLSNAQVSDTVSTGSQNANDVYYSLKNGIVKTEPINNWDLAFEIAGFSASIRSNHVKGIDVFQTHYPSAAWTTMDTTQKNTWKMLYNSQYVWTLGAFNRHTDGNFNLGWGVYDPGSHIIQGDSIYVLKFADGSFKKITFINLNSGTYNFKYANLDGSGEKTMSISKTDYKTKNFVYYTFAGDAIIDREPATANWDLIFTKYTEFIPTPYNVAGVWTNKGVKCAEARNVSTSIVNYLPFYFSDTASKIGYDWKTYNGSTNSYDITDNLVYFVRTSSNEVYKIVFTGYIGGASGSYYFTKQAIIAGIKHQNQPGISMFPNPVNDVLNIKLSDGYKLVNFTILDFTGKVILTGNNEIISTQHLNQGVYNIVVETETGFSNFRFLKTSK